MAKIYTKKGDRGETSLYGGGRVRKGETRVVAYGTVDELSSFLGAVIPELDGRWEIPRRLRTIQHHLFRIGGVLADPEGKAKIDPPDAGEIERLEAAIDDLEREVPPLTNFILPGGSRPGALLHVARAVCRRAERAVVDLVDRGGPVPEEALVYLNRLSDYLFVAARAVNLRLEAPETVWDPDF